MWLFPTHVIDPQHTSAARKAALDHLNRAIDEAVEAGLLDHEFSALCTPDVINEFWDAAERLQEAM